MQAVKFDQYGDASVLDVREVADPVAEPGRVVVRVRAAGINPGEIAIREGVFAKQWPATFPSGEGSDFAGEVESVGDGVTAWAVGDEVLGWTEERASHAELVAVPADQIIAKPAELPWEVAGALYVAPSAGWASVEAVQPAPGETVVVSGAAGGAGSVAAQLAVHRGARVIGLAGEANHDWLRSRGIEPIQYGDGQADRIRAAAPEGVDAFIDTFGQGYADLAIELGVAPTRINTIIDFAAVERLGISADGNAAVADGAAVLTELADLIVGGAIELPIAATYPLAQVQEAYAQLAERHTRGKIVLLP